MKLKHIVYIIILIGIQLQAQLTEFHTIQGVVKNAANKPIQNVNIKFKNSGTITDEYGKYNLKVNYLEKIQLIVSHVSYQTDTVLVMPDKNQNTTNYNITLVP